VGKTRRHSDSIHTFERDDPVSRHFHPYSRSVEVFLLRCSRQKQMPTRTLPLRRPRNDDLSRALVAWEEDGSASHENTSANVESTFEQEMLTNMVASRRSLCRFV
jgi:hypothetical protein